MKPSWTIIFFVALFCVNHAQGWGVKTKGLACDKILKLEARLSSAKVRKLIRIVRKVQPSNDNPESQEAWERIDSSFKRLIRHYARPFIKKQPQNEEEIMQAAYVGFWSAILKFDFKRGASLSNFAQIEIRSALQSNDQKASSLIYPLGQGELLEMIDAMAAWNEWLTAKGVKPAPEELFSLFLEKRRERLRRAVKRAKEEKKAEKAAKAECPDSELVKSLSANFRTPELLDKKIAAHMRLKGTVTFSVFNKDGSKDKPWEATLESETADILDYLIEKSKIESLRALLGSEEGEREDSEIHPDWATALRLKYPAFRKVGELEAIFFERFSKKEAWGSGKLDDLYTFLKVADKDKKKSNVIKNQLSSIFEDPIPEDSEKRKTWFERFDMILALNPGEGLDAIFSNCLTHEQISVLLGVTNVSINDRHRKGLEAVIELMMDKDPDLFDTFDEWYENETRPSNL
jgi:DNA-directed RNA polymerase sigma subunit (sigma70/sigma32)